MTKEIRSSNVEGGVRHSVPESVNAKASQIAATRDVLATITSVSLRVYQL